MFDENKALLDARELNCFNYRTVGEIVFLEEDVHYFNDKYLFFRKFTEGKKLNKGHLYRLMGVHEDPRISCGNKNWYKIIGLFQIERVKISDGEPYFPLRCLKIYDIFPIEEPTDVIS